MGDEAQACNCFNEDYDSTGIECLLCRWSALSVLASNLCMVGALSLSYSLNGKTFRVPSRVGIRRVTWRPNTRGHTAPGFDDGTSVSPSVEVPDTTSLVGSGGGLRTHNPSTASNTEAREAPETTGPIRSSCDIALQEMAWWEQGRATTPKDEQ